MADDLVALTVKLEREDWKIVHEHALALKMNGDSARGSIQGVLTAALADYFKTHGLGELKTKPVGRGGPRHRRSD
ncbi:hypothetical protein [Azospirillum sp.]|uniref:hypothetical protein n=1 Tax=Azospirillum sp. TaxID=34012 RepID=UPI002D27D753|nr:hypothetical protein [Azospirillum sp.]HYF88098.1 hypothetical protein [Azospirillum sp.]